MSNFEEYPLDANDVYVNGDPNLRYPQPPPSGGTDLDSLDLSTNESSDDDLFVTKEDGGTAWVKKSFLKIWNYIKTKIGISAQGSTGKYLDEQGNFTTPPNTTYGVVSKTANGLAPHLPDETTTTKYLRQDGMWAVPPDTKKGNGITTYAAKTGSGTTVTSTIVANTTMDNAIGTLLNNDVALNSALNNKINISDIINNLTSSDTNKPLSALQGKNLNDAIKKMGFYWYHGDSVSLGTFLNINLDRTGIPLVFAVNGFSDFSGIGLTLGISWYPIGVSSAPRTILFCWGNSTIGLIQTDLNTKQSTVIKTFS